MVRGPRPGVLLCLTPLDCQYFLLRCVRVWDPGAVTFFFFFFAPGHSKLCNYPSSLLPQAPEAASKQMSLEADPEPEKVGLLSQSEAARLRSRLGACVCCQLSRVLTQYCEFSTFNIDQLVLDQNRPLPGFTNPRNLSF